MGRKEFRLGKYELSEYHTTVRLFNLWLLFNSKRHGCLRYPAGITTAICANATFKCPSQCPQALPEVLFSLVSPFCPKCWNCKVELMFSNCCQSMFFLLGTACRQNYTCKIRASTEDTVEKGFQLGIKSKNFRLSAMLYWLKITSIIFHKMSVCKRDSLFTESVRSRQEGIREPLMFAIVAFCGHLQ